MASPIVQLPWKKQPSWITGLDPGGSLGYAAPNGTSFAAPHVSGVAALVLGVDGSLDVASLEQLLYDSAQDVGAPGYDTSFGAGIVDAYAAVLAALGQESPALMPGEKVEVRLVQVTTGATVFSTTTTESATLLWNIADVGQGEYRLVAGTDRDFDGDVEDAGEVSGRWTDPMGGSVLRILPGQDLANLDFAIAPK